MKIKLDYTITLDVTPPEPNAVLSLDRIQSIVQPRMQETLEDLGFTNLQFAAAHMEQIQ